MASEVSKASSESVASETLITWDEFVEIMRDGYAQMLYSYFKIFNANGEGEEEAAGEESEAESEDESAGAWSMP